MTIKVCFFYPLYVLKIQTMNNEIFAYNPTCTITQILSCDTLCLKIILRTGTKKQQITVPHNGEKLYSFFGGTSLALQITK